MAILTDSMTGSEFKAAINTAFEDCVSKSYTGEQTLTGSLSNLNVNGEIVSGSLKIGDITIGNKNDYLKNVIEGINSLWANEIVATDLAAGNISFFKDIMYLTENTYIEGNKWYRENNNSKTVVQLQQGNIELTYNNASGINYAIKSIGYGNFSDNNVLNSNSLVLTAFDDNKYYSTLYLQPPYQKGSNSYNKLAHSLKLSRKSVGHGNAADDIGSNGDINDYYIYGDHNPFFHPLSGAFFIQYDETTPNYKSEIASKGNILIGSNTGSKESNGLYLRVIDKDKNSENYWSTLEIHSPHYTNSIEKSLQDRLTFQSGKKDYSYKIWGEHNMKLCIVNPTDNNLTFSFSDLKVDFVPSYIELIGLTGNYIKREYWYDNQKWKNYNDEWLIQTVDMNERKIIFTKNAKNFNMVLKFYA